MSLTQKTKPQVVLLAALLGFCCCPVFFAPQGETINSGVGASQTYQVCSAQTYQVLGRPTKSAQHSCSCACALATLGELSLQGRLEMRLQLRPLVLRLFSSDAVACLSL